MMHVSVVLQAKKLLVQALNEFASISNDRPNRAETLGFIMTVLESKYAHWLFLFF
jgi:hypothetical protein